METVKHRITSVKNVLTGKLKTPGLRIALGIAFGMSLAAPAIPAYAQDGIELGGEGATGWAISGIMPGQSGTRTVTLTNTEGEPGQVFIWVSNIESTEGDNPEPETDTEGEGELLENLLFSVTSSHSGFVTDITMPTTLDNFPTAADGTPYITIDPLGAGETATITWEWELPFETGNEAQGDCIVFDINYTIIGEPPLNITTTAGRSGRTCECSINVLSEIYDVRVDCCNNTVNGTRVYLDPEEINFLEIERGTALVCGECLECGNYPRWIVMSPLEDPPPPPEGMTQVGPTYEIIGYSDEEMEHQCTSVVFGKPVVLLLDYDPAELPGDTSSVIIAYYDEELGDWVELPPDTGRVAEVGDVTARLMHLSTFGIFAREGEPPAEEDSPPSTTVPDETPSPGDALFTIGDMSIVPDKQIVSFSRFFAFQVKNGSSVTVSTDITNRGGKEGSYQADLQVDGEIVETKEVNLPPGQSREVVFTVSDIEPGSHTLRLAGLDGEFVTSVWTNWWLIAGLATAFGLMIWAIWYFAYRRRRIARK